MMKKGVIWLAALMFILVLAACGSSKDSGASGPEITASEQLVIKASNYEFDQPEYRLKKACLSKLSMKTSTEITACLYPN